MSLSKELENIIRNNVKFDDTAPWSYIVYQNKHIPHGKVSLTRKIAKIDKYARKNNGYCKMKTGFHLVGDNLTVRVEMNCDCVAAKAFDAVVKEKNNSYIFVSLDKETGVWSAVASANRADNHPVRFCEEKDYPVDLYYMRTDINGSGIMEKELCNNRNELLETLNWLGKCGFTPWDVWDFHIGTSRNEKAMEIFAAGRRKRAEYAHSVLDDMIDDADSKRLESKNEINKEPCSRTDNDMQK